MIGFALDMDGTIYLGENPIPGSPEFIQKLRDSKVPFRFVTNNSSHTRSFYSDRLTRMGIHVEPEQILTSAIAASRYLREHRSGKKVYIVATPDVRGEILSSGVEESAEGDVPDIVLLTYDTTISYQKINNVYHYLKKGAELIATHPDNLCPSEDGFDIDLGPFIRMFESMAGCRATVIGKPNRLMLDMAALEMGLDARNVVMVGDRLMTDIRMAQDAGTCSVLVLSGETDMAMLEESDVHPAFIKDSVRSIDIGEIEQTLP